MAQGGSPYVAANQLTDQYSRMSSPTHGVGDPVRGRNSSITGLRSITGVPSIASSPATLSARPSRP